MIKGNLRKMSVKLESEVKYTLDLDTNFPMNSIVGSAIRIEWNGRINCLVCNKLTKKSFGQGFCYNCFIKSPQASECILRPELCRAHLGEGRDPEWEQKNHNTPHIVYLALSSAVKVGVTRADQIPTRWIDQGASFAIKLAETKNRYHAGRIEVALKDFFTDKTNWQRMLKNEIDTSIDLEDEKWSLEEHLPIDIIECFSSDDSITEINYPVYKYPDKVKSLSLDRTPIIEGILNGIKGQYLIFEGGEVLNIRKHTSYDIEFSKI